MDQASLFDFFPSLKKDIKKKEPEKAKKKAGKKETKNEGNVAPTNKMLKFKDDLESCSTISQIASVLAEYMHKDFYRISFVPANRNYGQFIIENDMLGYHYRTCADRSNAINVSEDGSYHGKKITIDILQNVGKDIFSVSVKMSATYERSKLCHSNYPDSGYFYRLSNFEISKWKQVKKLLPAKSYNVVDKQSIDEAFDQYYPYCKDIQKEYELPKEMIMCAPQLEQIAKMNFAFMPKGYELNKSYCNAFNRLTKPGSNPKSFFKTEKPVWEMLKDETDMGVWDMYRKLYKKGIGKDVLHDLYDRGMDDKELACLNSILAQEIKGKHPFTWTSLLRYLDRIDQYEAIERSEGLMLISDYLRMCKSLDMEPKVDGDSLKREHDVCARLCRQRRDDIMAKKMESACEKLQALNYEEDTFFIRGCQGYDDLMNEAKQQHNCVGSYANSIARGTSFIYFMRQKAHPDRSLVTVEINANGDIRQKFLAFNKPIHNKAMSDFLDRWRKRIKKNLVNELSEAS